MPVGSEMNKPLGGIRILEYGEGVTAPAAAKYMADLGAQVIKIERPGEGDIARRIGPFCQDRPDQDSSALFLYLNTNKFGITLDPSAAGRDIFLRLVKESDVLVENHAPGFMASLGLGYDTLKEINPMLVMTSITPFGQTGPYRDYKGSDLIAFHMGGIAMETPEQVDSSSEAPLRGGSYQAHYLTAITAAIATMAMVLGRSTLGHGTHLDISELEAVADNQRHLVAQYHVDHERHSRVNGETKKAGHFGSGGCQPCKDGYVQLHIVENHMWQAFAQVIGKPEWANDQRFLTRPARNAHWDIIEPAIKAYTLARTKAEIAMACQSRHIPCAPVNQPEDLATSPHLKERGFFVQASHPAVGALSYPGSPAVLTGARWSLDRAAPRLGEHNDDVFMRKLGYSKEELSKLRDAGVI
ncbi:MAG: CoA transferase [Chloroflexi bacterium]|nr:CoA transferase [Chloroflexota bacterium]